MTQQNKNQKDTDVHLLDKLSVGAVSGRFVPIRYYITEFFCWVVCGIDFYKDYRRFYKGQDKGQSVSNHFFCLQDKCSSQCQNCKNIRDAG